MRKKLEKAGPILNVKLYSDIRKKDFEFHKLLAHTTRNPAFAFTLDYLVDFMSEFMKNVISPNKDHWTAVMKEHRDIFSSIKEGKAEEAAIKMLSHLQRLKTLLEDKHIEFINGD